MQSHLAVRITKMQGVNESSAQNEPSLNDPKGTSLILIYHHLPIIFILLNIKGDMVIVRNVLKSGFYTVSD
ncbi:hypothetical protein HanPI659440_Chr08g0296161 [Helianthus annuus]|nr:hypothetical protein HanPI659440_Chr08g0296161 [Helianthus annuus]